MRPSVLGAEPGEAPCGHPRLVSSAHLAPRPSRPSALSPSARVRPGCSWEEPRLAARSHLVSVASQVTVPAVTALPLVTGPRPPFPLRRMPHSQGPGRRGRQQRRTHGVGGVGRGRPQGRAGRCPEQTGLLHAHTVSLQTCLRGWRSGSCHRSPPRKQTRTPRPTAPHRCTPVADAGAAGQLSWSKQEGSQYPEFSPPGVGRRRGNSLKKKKKVWDLQGCGKPHICIPAPRELCRPPSLGHTGRQEGISFQVPNAFLVGGLPWWGGATGPEVHAASRSATREPAQEIPTWPAAQSPPSSSPHPDPGRGSEVVAKVSGGGPGRGLG